MARYDRAKTGTGQPLNPNMKLRLDAQGRFVPVPEPAEPAQAADDAQAAPDDEPRET